MHEFFQKTKGKLIVSCQARVGWPMYGASIMAAFAKAAEEGGAAGIRANAPENVAAIKAVTTLPIIGLNKIWDEAYEVYITPTLKSAEAVIEAGANVVAIDATERKRPGGETVRSIVEALHSKYPQILIMGDVDTFEAGIKAAEDGVDMVSTTLSGYTAETKACTAVNLELIKQLSKSSGKPVFAEGHIQTKEEALECLKWGAHSVVVGTAITRPEVITRRFVEEMERFI